MKTVRISTTKVKPRLHEFIHRAIAGERVVITMHGVPVAEIRSLVELPDEHTAKIAQTFASPSPPAHGAPPVFVPPYKLPGRDD